MLIVMDVVFTLESSELSFYIINGSGGKSMKVYLIYSKNANTLQVSHGRFGCPGILGHS